mmetsp:Transcript_38398/g.88851  ORF Transcript_38398/g.88851 Transcript_38398/m.88851 type:complete len:350 (+) Transcript_38398:595-1644(+)
MLETVTAALLKSAFIGASAGPAPNQQPIGRVGESNHAATSPRRASTRRAGPASRKSSGHNVAGHTSETQPARKSTQRSAELLRIAAAGSPTLTLKCGPSWRSVGVSAKSATRTRSGARESHSRTMPSAFMSSELCSSMVSQAIMSCVPTVQVSTTLPLATSRICAVFKLRAAARTWVPPEPAMKCSPANSGLGNDASREDGGLQNRPKRCSVFPGSLTAWTVSWPSMPPATSTSFSWAKSNASMPGRPVKRSAGSLPKLRLWNKRTSLVRREEATISEELDRKQVTSKPTSTCTVEPLRLASHLGDVGDGTRSAVACSGLSLGVANFPGPFWQAAQDSRYRCTFCAKAA